MSVPLTQPLNRDQKKGGDSPGPQEGTGAIGIHPGHPCLGATKHGCIRTGSYGWILPAKWLRVHLLSFH